MGEANRRHLYHAANPGEKRDSPPPVKVHEVLLAFPDPIYQGLRTLHTTLVQADDTVPKSFADFLAQVTAIAGQQMATALRELAQPQAQDFCGQRLVLQSANGAPLDCTRPKGHEGECSPNYIKEEWT